MLRADPLHRRLDDAGDAALGIIVVAQHAKMNRILRAAVGMFVGRASRPVDRPRRIRLKRTTSRLQQQSDRHAIDTLHEVSHRMEGEDAEQQREDRRCPVASRSRTVPRVARQLARGDKNSSRHERHV